MGENFPAKRLGSSTTPSVGSRPALLIAIPTANEASGEESSVCRQPVRSRFLASFRMTRELRVFEGFEGQGRQRVGTRLCGPAFNAVSDAHPHCLPRFPANLIRFLFASWYIDQNRCDDQHLRPASPWVYATRVLNKTHIFPEEPSWPTNAAKQLISRSPR